jgi:hypothetical protein
MGRLFLFAALSALSTSALAAPTIVYEIEMPGQAHPYRQSVQVGMVQPLNIEWPVRTVSATTTQKVTGVLNLYPEAEGANYRTNITLKLKTVERTRNVGDDAASSLTTVGENKVSAVLKPGESIPVLSKDSDLAFRVSVSEITP